MLTKILIAMAFLNMIAEVSIGEITIPHVNSIVIEESVKEISDKATITLARNYKQLAGTPILNYIQAGMPVTIKLGYAGYENDLQTEFTGYVRPGISADYPLVIECDELFPLREQNIVFSSRDVSLRELLTKAAPGYTIECPDAQLGKMLISNASGFQVMQTLKDKYGFFTRINGNTISTGYAYDYRPSFTKNHKYIIGNNVKDVKALKFKTDNDFNTVLRSVIRVGKKKKVLTVGNPNQQHKVQKATGVAVNMTEAEAKRIMESQLHQMQYNGYTGNIVGFGLPRTHAGDSIEITDPKEPERAGTYLIDKVVIEFEEASFSRTNYLSFKI